MPAPGPHSPGAGFCLGIAPAWRKVYNALRAFMQADEAAAVACVACGTIYQPTRSWSRYCSAACRQAYWRRLYRVTRRAVLRVLGDEAGGLVVPATHSSRLAESILGRSEMATKGLSQAGGSNNELTTKEAARGARS